MSVYIALMAAVVLFMCARWLTQMARAPEFLFAAKICSAVNRKPGSRTYWRRIVRDFSLITEIVDAKGVVRYVDMRCPHLAGDVLADFTTARGGEWLESIGECKWRVRADRLVKMGSRFAGIEVTIDYDKKFGTRIAVTKKTLPVSEARSPLPGPSDLSATDGTP